MSCTEEIVQQKAALNKNEADGPEQKKGKIVTAPLVGTFYAAPAEDEEPFVKVGGASWEKGQIVAIIEAMKLMNEIESDFAGTVTEVFVENGQSVDMDSHFLQLDNRKGQDRTMHSLNTEQIQQIIPHRHPFLLIDQIEDYVPGEYAVGIQGCFLS